MLNNRRRRKNTTLFSPSPRIQATESGVAFWFNHFSLPSYPAFPIMHMTPLLTAGCLLTIQYYTNLHCVVEVQQRNNHRVSALTAFRGFGGTVRLQFFELAHPALFLFYFTVPPFALPHPSPPLPLSPSPSPRGLKI